VIIGPSPQTVIKYEQAHGIIMGTTVVLLFPFGAMYMRLGGGAWMHGALQVFSLCALISGFGLGIKLGQFRGYVRSFTSLFLSNLPFPSILLPSNEQQANKGEIALQIHRPNPHHLRHSPRLPLPHPTLPRHPPPPPIPQNPPPRPRLLRSHLVRTHPHALRYHKRWAGITTSG